MTIPRAFSMPLFSAATVLGVGLAAATPCVLAQGAGGFALRAGAIRMQPHVDSGGLSAPAPPARGADVDGATQAGAGLTYWVTDHVSIDMPLTLPFKIRIAGAGAIAGAGQIADVRALPITLLGQYRWLEPGAAFDPYVGAGITYTKFYRAHGSAALSALTNRGSNVPTTVSVESKLAPTLQLGAAIVLDPRWFVDVSVTHTFLKSRITLSTGQTLDVRLNPDTISLAVGYRF